MISKKDYKIIGTFKGWVLQNFPFIEADFDAITSYQLWCKVVEYLNKIGYNEALLEDAVNDITDYLNNLDLQDEVDNKLDEMVESGQLQEIIADYLNSKAIFGFDTKSDMLNATNLIDGSYARTLGNTNYSTGDGNLYKIRKIKNTDVIDNDHITPLNTSSTLVAEKIPYTNNKSLQNQITANTNRLNLFDNRKVIMIGDSYANRENSWQDRIKTYANLDNTNSVLNRKSGAGFVASPDSTNFITMLTSGVTIPANEVTDIIVCGGMNDRFHTITEIETAIGNFVATARSTYPNAEIYLGFISWVSPEFENYSSTIGTLTNICNAYKRACTHGSKVHYLNNVEYTMHNIEEIDDSHAHPNDTAQARLAQNIMTAWITGSCDVEQSDSFGITATTTGNITAVSGQFIGGISNGLSYLKSNGAVSVTFDTSDISLGSTKIELGTLNGGFLTGRANMIATPVAVLLQIQNVGYIKAPCELYLNENKLSLKFQVCDLSGWVSGRIVACTISEFSMFGTSMQQY